MSKIAEPYVRRREEHPGGGNAARAIWRVYCIFFVLIGVYIAVHIIPAWLSHDSPPVACQLLGGHWTIWNGWRCG
jgi:hypothetical protein